MRIKKLGAILLSAAILATSMPYSAKAAKTEDVVVEETQYTKGMDKKWRKETAIVHKYDTSGNLTEYAENKYDSTGKVWHSVKREYTIKNGRCTSHIEYYNDEISEKVAYTYSTNGKLSRKTGKTSEGIKSSIVKFNKNGYETSSIGYNIGFPANEVDNKAYETKYDGKGHCLSEKVYDVWGNIVRQHKYDSKGNEIYTAYYDGITKYMEDKSKNTYKGGTLSKVSTNTYFFEDLSSKRVTTYYTTGSKKGYKKSIKETDTNGKVLGTTTFKYKVKDNHVVEQIEVKDGQEISKIVYKWETIPKK